MRERVVASYGTQVKDATSLRSTFCTNVGYRGCRTPLEDAGNGRVRPAVKSRLFVEDVPYGLVILRDIASLIGIAVPEIDSQIRWHQRWMGVTYLTDAGELNRDVDTGAPTAYGITTLDELVEDSLAVADAPTPTPTPTPAPAAASSSAQKKRARA